MHRELATTPLARLLDSDDASRRCPGTGALTAAFRITVTRTLRRSDATVSVAGVRYQVPAPWRHLRELHLRVARWDLASVELVDARTFRSRKLSSATENGAGAMWCASTRARPNANPIIAPKC